MIPRSKPIQIKSCIDFDEHSEDSLDELKSFSEKLGSDIGNSQISTQSNIVSLWGTNQKGTIPTLERTVNSVKDLAGKQWYVPKDFRLLKFHSSDETLEKPRYSFVISGIKHTTVIDISSPTVHLLISNCRGLVIRMKGCPIAGIECINSRDIIFEADHQNFLRATTSSSVKFHGDYDSDVILLDVRNCDDVYVNDERLNVNVFKEGRYRHRDDGFTKLTDSEDIFVESSRSLPNVSLLKHHYTNKP